MAEPTTDNLKRTPLHDLHEELGAKLVPFAGYEMPVQYPMGVKDEHLWTRSEAGLFDVSHMGPCFLSLADGIGGGDEAHAKIAALIETLVPSDIAGLKEGQARLTVLLNDEGGILDDLIITRPIGEEAQGSLYIVVNGAVKEADWALFERTFEGKAVLTRADDRILFALQGPKAAEVMQDFFPGCAELKFMRHMPFELNGTRCIVSRCGYTGEDGFEVLVSPEAGVPLIKEMLTDERVKPIGLGARDSLRLEAGLCLYGHDMDTTRDPVEADLAWVIQKKRREQANFPGAERILKALSDGPAEKRVGIKPLERAPAREGTVIEIGGEPVGVVTSGGFGPSVDGPVAMGYVRADLAEPGTKIDLMVRGKARAAEVCELPFVKPNYNR
ncbi:MAG TPA: glycine cleavage system aminomethyltransferase GcvT [Hyphomonas atlantica]|uniref:aminomethyltransferase n=1 Tax=Hyphomonas atlantica TaxID=1280948 RepID=A0A356W7S4_9PROT|nr:glycine cleavage system aminomethyltransferase GcvT [Hyphomonas atlantica]